MPVGLKDLSQIFLVQFKIAKDRFTYLGIVNYLGMTYLLGYLLRNWVTYLGIVTRKFSLLREANYASLLEKNENKHSVL